MSEAIRVLCLDDNAIIAMEIEAILNEAEDMLCVGVLGSADDLLDEIKKSKPDVVLLDLTMPGTSPLKALKNVSRLYPHIKVIVFSGYDDRRSIEEVEQAGAWGFISKSGDVDAILSTIRRAREANTMGESAGA